MNSKTIKIFTEGGPNIGLGHISRCTSLYDEIENFEYEAVFYIFGEIEGIELLKDRKVYSVNWMEEDYITENVKSEDLCIVDSYLATQELLESISLRAKKVLYIDDTNRINYPRGIIVNPSLDVSGMNYSKTQSRDYLLGPEYIILRSSFLRMERRTVRNSVCKVIITMGGSDFRQLTPAIINEVSSCYPHIQFDVIIGAAFTNLDEISALSYSNVSLHYNIDENTMREMMISADVAITAAGQTIYELIATRTPFIPIQIAENQSNNIHSIQKLGLITKSILYSSQSFISDLNVSFTQLLDFKVRKNLIKKFENIIDGKGRRRIIDKLTADEIDPITLRAITFSDCDLIYEWASDELVRKNAFNPDKIDYESHKEWFQSKLCSRNTFMYIILAGNAPVGQIRIDIENDCGIIDYSIDSDHRGRGFGKAALREVGENIRKDCPRLKMLIGRVKFDNTSSQKAFESANFEKDKKKDYFEYRIFI